MDWASFAFRFNDWVGKRALAGWDIVMVAGLSKEAKRKYIGLSSCPCHTSGATNQKAVSICAFVFKTNTLTKMKIKRKQSRLIP